MYFLKYRFLTELPTFAYVIILIFRRSTFQVHALIFLLMKNINVTFVTSWINPSNCMFPYGNVWEDGNDFIGACF